MVNIKKQSGWDDLEIFTSKGARLGKALVTIIPTAAFIFNAGFIHKAKLRQYTHVILGYSELKRAVIFDFGTDEKAKGALTLTKNGNISVGSNAFFKYYFLDPSDLRGKYEPQQEKLPKLGDVWVIYLDKRIPPATENV